MLDVPKSNKKTSMIKAGIMNFINLDFSKLVLIFKICAPEQTFKQAINLTLRQNASLEGLVHILTIEVVFENVEHNTLMHK